MRVSMAAGLTVVGALGLVVGVMAGSGRGAATGVAANGIFIAPFWGLLTWFMARGQTRRLLEDAPVTAQPPRRSAGAAMWHGLALTVLIAVLAGLWPGVMDRWSGKELHLNGILWGIVLGGGVLSALQARHLHRWQDGSGLVVYTRQGGPWIAGTTGRARRQFVLVRLPRATGD